MLIQEQTVEVSARRGAKVMQIARELEISRNTLPRYLRDPQAGRSTQREQRPRKQGATALDPAMALLREVRQRLRRPEPFS